MTSGVKWYFHDGFKKEEERHEVPTARTSTIVCICPKACSSPTFSDFPECASGESRITVEESPIQLRKRLFLRASNLRRVCTGDGLVPYRGTTGGTEKKRQGDGMRSGHSCNTGFGKVGRSAIRIGIQKRVSRHIRNRRLRVDLRTEEGAFGLYGCDRAHGSTAGTNHSGNPWQGFVTREIKQEKR